MHVHKTGEKADLEDTAPDKPALILAKDRSAGRGLDIGPNLLEEGVNVDHRHLAGWTVAVPVSPMEGPLGRILYQATPL